MNFHGPGCSLTREQREHAFAYRTRMANACHENNSAISCVLVWRNVDFVAALFLFHERGSLL